MEYRTLPLSCDCGGTPKQISAIGLSSTHELVIHWRCPRCRKNVCTVKTLADCWLDCFGVPERSGDAGLGLDSADDRRFLQSIGVRLSDE